MIDEIKQIKDLIESGVRKITISGLRGGSAFFIVSELFKILETKKIIIICTDRERVDWEEGLGFFLPHISINSLPGFIPPTVRRTPSSISVSVRRSGTLWKLLNDREGIFIFTTSGIIQKAISKERLINLSWEVRKMDEIDRGEFFNKLLEMGYQMRELVEERGEFSLRGAIVDIYPPLEGKPLRIEFDGDTVVSIRYFDPITQRSVSSIDSFTLIPINEFDEDGQQNVFSYLDNLSIIIMRDYPQVLRECDEYLERIEKLRSNPASANLIPWYLERDELHALLEKSRVIYLERMELMPSIERGIFLTPFKGTKEIIFAALSHDMENRPLEPLVERLREKSLNYSIYILASSEHQTQILLKLFDGYGLPIKRGSSYSYNERPGIYILSSGTIPEGFIDEDKKRIFLAESEIFGQKERCRTVASERGLPFIETLRDLKIGDLVVHTEYGIGIYRGLRKLSIEGVSGDFLHIEYEGGDRLYVPVNKMHLVQRYIGTGREKPKISKLGTGQWLRTKKRVKSSLKEMASELLRIQAEREVLKGFSFPSAEPYQTEFNALFPYEETPDQIRTEEEIMDDMGKEKPMDRIVVGDVGFGKTEVAMRAAFRAVMAGKQVAVLVPTTILSQQHERVFRERFRGWPVHIEALSRFKDREEQKRILKDLSEGKVDIVIGTHRLLQRDVAFKDLGLLIIDEEHKFGVAHKEYLRKIKSTVDTLTLTATPIPRTLQMALSGIKEMSRITTPPYDRKSVKTIIAPFDRKLIREAIMHELERGGQVFFVHNRVKSMHIMERFLRALVPEASLAVAHGEMRSRELERTMWDFVRGKYNLLLCSTIIESGLDIATANTLIVNRADKLGLAQLYHLRGRVGRSSVKAFAYFLIPSGGYIRQEAAKRLNALQELEELGSGFRLSLLDLEIRGAGNLLGPEQSGHIDAVGFELYTNMLEEAVRELKGERLDEEIDPEIDLKIPAYIPESYIADEGVRFSFYKRLLLSSEDGIEKIMEELRDRYGPPSQEVINLFCVIRIRNLMRRIGIKKITYNGQSLCMEVAEGSVEPERIINMIRKTRSSRITPNGRFLVYKRFESAQDLLDESINLLKHFLEYVRVITPEK